MAYNIICCHLLWPVSTAPCATVLAHVLSQGIPIIEYLDNFLLRQQSAQALSANIQQTNADPTEIWEDPSLIIFKYPGLILDLGPVQGFTFPWTDSILSVPTV